jgi:hypothetical protein
MFRTSHIICLDRGEDRSGGVVAVPPHRVARHGHDRGGLDERSGAISPRSSHLPSLHRVIAPNHLTQIMTISKNITDLTVHPRNQDGFRWFEEGKGQERPHHPPRRGCTSIRPSGLQVLRKELMIRPSKSPFRGELL